MVFEQSVAYHLPSALVVGDQLKIVANRELLASVVFPLRLQASQPIAVMVQSCYGRFVVSWSSFVRVECVR